MSNQFQQESPAVVQQTTVINVGNRKSVVGAVLLALLFGPLGMLYSTVVGALVMLFVNLLVAIPTLGLGLILTVPIGAVWAGIAASNHNSSLGTLSTQAVARSAAPATAPAGWHPDPDGGSRLRYWDGSRWTEQYAERPSEEAPALAESAAADAKPPVEAEAATVALSESNSAGRAMAFCESCGEKVGGADKFCPACGVRQESNS